MTYANVFMVNSFPIYIAQDRAFSFQLRDNITQFLTLNATNNAFNITTNTLIMDNDEGLFYFTPNTDSTIRINHNMDYVTIKGYNHTNRELIIGSGNYYTVYENEQVNIIFRIKGYDISRVFAQIVFFVLSVVGLIITPPISDIVSKNDKMQQIFIWVCGWLFFGMLFFVWIYAW